MPKQSNIHLSELSLTLGNWGRPPLSVDQQRQILRTLGNWAERTGNPVSAEVYARPTTQTPLLEEWADGDLSPELIVREDPRSDRLKHLSQIGMKRIVIDVPVSPQTAIRRFRPKGIEQVAPYAVRVARDSLLAGLTPEIALLDIARANKFDVLMIVDRIMEAVRPHGGEHTISWRLIDSTGWADPIAGARLPRSLSAWVRMLNKEFEIPRESISVQCADTLGFANANTIAGAQTGASVVTSLLGLGMGCGWAATEVALAHLLGEKANTKRLLGLSHVLLGEMTPGLQINPGHPGSLPRLAGKSGSSEGLSLRDDHRPVSGPHAWQFPGGAAPEKPSAELLEAHFPIPAKSLSRHDPEPLLTSLSGHAGLLHLMHREWSDRHFATEDERVFAISQSFENEFANGRQVPVSWAELMPKVLASGIVEDTPVDE
jgi:hypothetical protein